MSQSIPRYMVVEGVIGVGKSTLVQGLARHLDATTVYEVFEENPFLARFYAEPERYAFANEMFFLLSRYGQQQAFSQQDILHQHAVSDYLFEKCRLFARQTLEGPELDLFDQTWNAFARHVAKPDLVIYLQAPIELLLERIHHRGRSYEQSIDPGYLEAIDVAYRRFFGSYTDAPVVRVDTSDVDFRDAALVERLLARIARGEVDITGEQLKG